MLGLIEKKDTFLCFIYCARGFGITAKCNTEVINATDKCNTEAIYKRYRVLSTGQLRGDKVQI